MDAAVQPNDLRIIEDYRNLAKNCDQTLLFAKAEEAMQSMLVLNGAGPDPVFVGFPPKWHENPYGVGGYTWTISRLNYMVTLCRAFVLSGEQRYLGKVETDLRNWLDENPAPPLPTDEKTTLHYHGMHHWRMLEVGYRLVYSFPTMLTVLRAYSKDRKLVEDLCQSIADHAQRIYMGSHLLWPDRDHNHYTEEVNGLLSAASLLPDHPDSPRWCVRAMEGLEHASTFQMTDDGAQVEGAGIYHTAVVVNLLYAIHFAGMLNKTFSDAFVQRTLNGILFGVHILTPAGENIPYGDSDSGGTNPTATSPVQAAVLGCLLSGDMTALKTLKKFIPLETIRQVFFNMFPWGFPRISEMLPLLENAQPEEGETLLPLTTHQRQMDLYICRSGWNRDAACLFFSCHSPIHYGNHAHMDQLGVIFAAHGKTLLQDPGRYTYKDCEDRHLFKSSQVHSVPTVAGRDAFEYIHTFGYGPQKPGAITAVWEDERLQCALGYHKNYDPVTCYRKAALLDGEILLIADTFTGAKDQELQIFFHLNSTHVEVTEDGVITRDDGANIQICSSIPEAKLLPGRLSDVFYHDYPSTRAVFSKVAQRDVEMAAFAALPFSVSSGKRLSDFRFDGTTITFACGEKHYTVAVTDDGFEVK